MTSKTLYWGIEIPTILFEDENVKSILSDDDNLIKRSKLHCTLLFVGRKQTVEETKYLALENVPCVVYCDALGYSENAAALRVSKIMYGSKELELYDMERPLHITLALAKNVKPKDSIYALIGGGNLKKFQKEIIVNGNITRYTR